MRKISPAVAYFLHVFLSGCTDYVKMEETSLGDNYDFPPIIDMKHLHPHPSRLMDKVSVGKNCNGQVFKVPPIEDPNKKDRLYYLWFIDNKLAGPQAIIEPDARRSAILTLKVDEQFLLSHFETKIPEDFFGRAHVIDFYISDVEYTIPESKYTKSDKEHSDNAYWIVYFSNDPC